MVSQCKVRYAAAFPSAAAFSSPSPVLVAFSSAFSVPSPSRAPCLALTIPPHPSSQCLKNNDVKRPPRDSGHPGGRDTFPYND